MRIAIIACKVFFRELSLIASMSDNLVDIFFLKQQLHDTPKILYNTLDETIKSIENSHEKYDAIALAYGLCSNGTVGISSKYKLVVPKVHDCISLLLGSKDKYDYHFNNNEGTYWLSTGWVERSTLLLDETIKNKYEEYIELYGEDNANYIIKELLGFLHNYKYCSYISWDEFKSIDSKFIELSKEFARFYNLEFNIVKGNSSYLFDLVNSNWDEERFLIVEPNKCIQPSYDKEVIKYI
ncbi:DUF1638 domain-containing protein [Caldicellulosiruptoraceae bacterium PP1]